MELAMKVALWMIKRTEPICSDSVVNIQYVYISFHGNAKGLHKRLIVERDNGKR